MAESWRSFFSQSIDGGAKAGSFRNHEKKNVVAVHEQTTLSLTLDQNTQVLWGKSIYSSTNTGGTGMERREQRDTLSGRTFVGLKWLLSALSVVATSLFVIVLESSA
jgi:hypothetical protein